MTKPIGYEALCNALLDGGVTSKQIIKHRFLLQAIAAQARTLPTAVRTDLRSWRFELDFQKRSMRLELDNLSSTATLIQRQSGDADGRTIYYGPMRASFTTISDPLLWLYPLEFTRFERLRIWLEQKWIALKVWCGKIRNR